VYLGKFVSIPFIYLTTSIRSVANGLASRDSDVDLCISDPVVHKIISESESKTKLSTRIGELICEFGSILKEKGKYFIESNRVSI
jgi:hypothetical protein